MNDTTLTVVGNLVDNPELNVAPSGTRWVRFSVASTPRRFDKASNSYKDGDALFVNCTAFRDLAEHIAESLTKGARVIVTGRLKQHRWETSEGEKRSSFGLDIEEIGPSLRFANARVQKLTRSRGDADMPPPVDPFASDPFDAASDTPPY